jgi:hypothetical protein
MRFQEAEILGEKPQIPLAESAPSVRYRYEQCHSQKRRERPMARMTKLEKAFKEISEYLDGNEVAGTDTVLTELQNLLQNKLDDLNEIEEDEDQELTDEQMTLHDNLNLHVIPAIEDAIDTLRPLVFG